MVKPTVFSWSTAPPGGSVTAPAAGLVSAGYANTAIPAFSDFNYVLQQLGLWTAWTNQLDSTLLPRSSTDPTTIDAAITSAAGVAASITVASYIGW